MKRIEISSVCGTLYIYRGIVDSPKKQLVYVCHNEDPLAVTLPLVIGLLFRKGVAEVLVAICICLNAIGYHSYISFLANKDVILRSWLIRFIYSILQFQKYCTYAGMSFQCSIKKKMTERGMVRMCWGVGGGGVEKYIGLGGWGHFY